jgi:hypothetical protein
MYIIVGEGRESFIRFIIIIITMNIIIKHTNVYILLLLLLLLELSCLRYHIFLYKSGFYRNNLELKKAHNILIVLNLKKTRRKRLISILETALACPTWLWRN